jgi:hypothetical protein
LDVKATGKFDDETRSVIKRWQAARCYPATGYLNKLQQGPAVGDCLGPRCLLEPSGGEFW